MISTVYSLAPSWRLLSERRKRAGNFFATPHPQFLRARHCCWVSCSTSITFYNFSGPGVDGGLDLTIGIASIVVPVAAIVVFTLQAPAQSLVRRWLLESAWLTRVGRYSFAMYVFHFSILAIIVRLMIRLYPSAVSLPDYDTKPALAVSGALISLGVAWISYEFFEKHFLRLKDRFRAGDSKPRQTVCSSRRTPTGTTPALTFLRN